MNRLRQFHLYLGCIFAPLLIFFAITGAWQTFNWHRGKKDGSYTPPRLLSELSAVHQYQDLPINGNPKPSFPFRLFVLAMVAGFVITSVLGIMMAFKYTRDRWIIWLCLISGIVLPVVLLYIGGGVR